MTEKLDTTVDALLSRPEEKTIHDIRTTSRRIQALTEILPKSIRKKTKVRTYLACARALFKTTTQIRDIDVVQSKLNRFEESPDVKQLLEEMKKTRENLLKATYKAADSLRKMGIPKFKANQISESKLSKRRKKILRKYQSILEKQMKVLLASPTLEKLHEFRKNCKMLRYTLELDSRKTDPLMTQLVRIQGSLGVVMDVQATLNSLSGLSASEALEKIIADLTEQREKANEDYLAMKSKLSSSLARLSSKRN